MGATYTRQSSYTDGDVITAAHTNDEFNQLLAAFAASTGHTHNGDAGEGGPISLLSDSDANNKVLIDESNNHLEFYVEVSGSAVQQIRIQDGAIVPITDNDIDLGTSSLEFKDLHIDGVANIDSLAMPTTTVTDILDEDNMSSNSATALATQQSIKAYVDAQLTAEDLDFQADSGGALSIDLDSETLTFTGGTGIDTSGSGNAVTFAIDSTVTTLTGSQTLTNKTLTTPTIASIVNSGTLTLPTSTDTLVGRATTDTLTNKTVDADNNTVSNIEVDNFKASAIVLESEGIGSNDNDTTIPTSAAVKDYVDTQITAEDLDFQADSGGALSIDLDSETLTFTGGTGIDTSGSGNAVTFAIDATVATLTGSQTLTNKTIDVDNNTVSNIEVDNLKSGVLDTDLSSVSGSDDTLASAKAIKAYVDSQSGLTDVVGDTTPQLGGDLDAQGKDLEDVGISSADSHAGIYGSSSAPVTITVTVASKTAAHPYNGDGSSSAYFLNGIESPALTLHGVDNVTSDSGYYYKFDQSDSSNGGHPLRFYLDADKTTAYTTGVTTNGTPGSAGAYTQIDVDEDTPSILYYQCSSHDYMGNHAIVLGSNKINHSEALISFPTATTTLVGTDTTDTLTNKTLTTPVIASLQQASGSNTLTMPAATDTLVGRATTDTLTNKRLTSPKINEDVALTSTATELNVLDGVTAGTVSASKGVVADANKDVSGFRNVSMTGDLTVAGDNITMGTNTAGHLLIAGGSNFAPTAITSLSEISSVDNADVFLAIDNTDGGLKKITRSTIISGLAISDASLSNIVEDTTPQLGGDLDVNGNSITGSTITLDSSGDIVLDAAGDDITLKDNGTTFGNFKNSSGQLVIQSGSTPTTAMTFDGANVTLAGNLTVSGTTTTVNSTTVNLNDHNIILDSGNSTSAVVNGAGITIEGGSGADAKFNYNTTGPKFELLLGTDYEDLQVDQLIAASSTISGTVQFGSLSDGSITITAFVDENDMASDSATLIPTQQSVKAYVDSQITAEDLDVTTDSGTIAIDLDSETMTIAGGEGIDTSATGNTVTIAGENATTSNKGIASFSSDNFSVSSGAVTIKDGGIVTAELAADAVTGAKIADNAINSEHYTDGSIDTAHIADLQVTTAKIAADAITGAKIADDAINSEHYTDGSIDTAHISADAITGAKIADNAIDSEHYTDGSIDTAHIGNLQVTTAKIAADAITSAKIADDAINSEHYTDGSIDTAHIADAQVTLAKVANQAANTVLVRDANSSGVVSAKAVTDTQILIGDGDGFTAASLSGDVTMTNAGAVTIASSAVENSMLAGSIADSKLNTISTADKVSLSALDIDGASDIGADLTTSDLIVVDDGAGGTNRKAALSRLTTFMQGQGFSSEDPTALAIALG